MALYHRAFALLTMGLLFAAGCGSGATPAPTPPATPTLTSIAVLGLGSPVAGDTVQLTATGTFSDGSTQTVTAQVTWQSSNQAIVTITSGGLASFLAQGDADIRATMNGITGTSHVTVAARQPSRFTLSGTVTDSATGAAVANANARILDGADAGKSGVTDAGGRFSIGDVGAGAFLVQFTRTDYETRSINVTMSGDTAVTMQLTPQAASVTRFYGTYNTALTIHQQTCDFPFAVGPTGTFKIEGNTSGSSMTITIVERGTTRTYQGAMQSDGSFIGNGGGVIAGFSPPVQKHEYTGSVAGVSNGSRVDATEFVTFTIPCPGAKMQIGYSGNK
jgi:hypothetical protein